MAWRRERRRNRFSHVLPSSSIAACAGDAGEAVSSPSAAAAAFALDACCCTGAGSVRHGAWGWFRSPRGMGAGSVRRQRRQQPLPGAATGQRTPGRALCTPRPCASPVRRCAVPSLTPASRGPAAIRSCSPRPFADVLSAHPGTVPSLGGPGWRFPLLLLFFRYVVFSWLAVLRLNFRLRHF